MMQAGWVGVPRNWDEVDGRLMSLGTGNASEGSASVGVDGTGDFFIGFRCGPGLEKTKKRT